VVEASRRTTEPAQRHRQVNQEVAFVAGVKLEARHRRPYPIAAAPGERSSVCQLPDQ
jgi:hypothetical protein